MFDWIHYIDNLDELMTKKTHSLFKYPHFGRINQLRPNPEIALGHYIFWTVKEDGSNAGVYVDKYHIPKVRSRNVDVANFCEDVMKLDCFHAIVDMINHYKENYGSEYMVFGEFLNSKDRRSPTGLKKYDMPSFIVFDIYDLKNKKFLPFFTMSTMCGSFGIPIVKLVGVCCCSTMEELYAYRDKMLEATVGEEGVVGKIYEKVHPVIEDEYLIFKEKHFIPKPIVDPFESSGKVSLPQLPQPEVEACLYKIRDRLTPLEFATMKIVMPAFAKEVSLECEQQNCSNKLNLGNLYHQIVSRTERKED